MMVVNRWKTFLFLLGCLAAAVGVASVAGLFDSYLDRLPDGHPSASQEQPMPEQGQSKPKDERPQPSFAQDAKSAPTEDAVVPAFDVVRVEPDGEVVVAGNARAHSTVELLAGTQIIGSAQADANGDFAIVPASPLKPGDHQLTLRFSISGQDAVFSEETAIVSIPDDSKGQVFVMVEKPGEASRVLTAPASTASASLETAMAGQSAGAPELSRPVLPQDAQALSTPPQAASSGAGEAAQAMAVAVEAVEIEGRKIFVAGTAETGRRVRIYADDLLIGEARAAPNGRFLVEAERDLPVGSYTIRADVLGDDGGQVVARAAVPFERQPGEAIAAVAPDNAAGEIADSSLQQEAAGADAGAAPPLEPASGTVIIRRGDTLWHISRRVYGRGIRYSTIYLANKEQIENPDMIWPGQVFSLPVHTQEGEAADFEAISGQPRDGASVATQ